MDENNFEGTLVLESIAAIGKIDEFFEALDSDDVDRVKLLMKKAKIDRETIETTIRKMLESDSDH